MLTCMNFRLHDHGLLAIYRQTSHNYSESFGKPCTQLLYSSATSSNEPFVCIQIYTMCMSSNYRCSHELAIITITLITALREV